MSYDRFRQPENSEKGDQKLESGKITKWVPDDYLTYYFGETESEELDR